jgi:prophage regulatory protein
VTKPQSTLTDRFLAEPEVLRIAGFSASTLRREIEANRFPAPVPISANRKGFLESEIRAWISARVNCARHNGSCARAEGGA